MVARVFIYCENETRGSPSRSTPVAVRSFLEPSKLLAPLHSQCGPVPRQTKFWQFDTRQAEIGLHRALAPSRSVRPTGSSGLTLARGISKNFEPVRLSQLIHVADRNLPCVSDRTVLWHVRCLCALSAGL